MKCLMVRIWVTSVVYGYSSQQLYCMTYIRLPNQDNYYPRGWTSFYDDTRTISPIRAENIFLSMNFTSQSRIPHSHSINLDSVTAGDDKTSYPLAMGNCVDSDAGNLFWSGREPTFVYQIRCNESSFGTIKALICCR